MGLGCAIVACLIVIVGVPLFIIYRLTKVD